MPPAWSSALRPCRGRQRHDGHHQDPQRRGHLQPQGKALGKDQYPCHPHQRVLHGDSGLGHEFKGQCRASAGGQGVPRYRYQGPVQPRQQADALSRTQEVPSPKGRKHLSPQRTGQVQDVQQGAQRPGRQERTVCLLRLPVDHEARQGCL